MTLDQRIIVITGAARGLGRGFAEACAKAGAKHIIVADIRADIGEQTAAALRAGGASAEFLKVDLGDPESITAFASEIERAHGHIDGLVNNAAIATGIGGKTFEEIDIETWDLVMRVNVRGLWLMVKAMASVDPHGYRQAARMLSSADIIADLERIPDAIPLQIIFGGADLITTPEANRRVAAHARGWKPDSSPAERQNHSPPPSPLI